VGPRCFFASDLHGRTDRYDKLLAAVAAERPAAVFLGGDLLPSGLGLAEATDPDHQDFINGFLAPAFARLQASLGPAYPAVFAILGNDDPRWEEAAMLEVDSRGLWRYTHGQCIEWAGFCVFGYSYVPPTPFRLKDWERYDVSRFVDPGCSSPEEGWRTVPADASEVRYGTIRDDLQALAGDRDLGRAIMLFHSPPYKTGLDRAALDGRAVDFVPLDVHVGSIAVQRFIEARQPLVTLHGHVHESARLTGEWHVRLGETHAFSAAHDGPELALVRFDPADLNAATRELL
jgi:uncharacterized protein